MQRMTLRLSSLVALAMTAQPMSAPPPHTQDRDYNLANGGA